MPYRIREGGQDCPFEVVKEGSGERMACHDTEEEAKKHLAALYANVPDAARSADDAAPPRAPIEWREGVVDNVSYPERVVTVIAVPYEQPADVEYLNDVYQEVFERGSMDHLITRPHRVRVNREHNKSRTVGKVIKFLPERPDGLVADIRIAKTPLGDETLDLAAEDCLSSSIGFAAPAQWTTVDRRAKTRRIKSAYLDHISFVESPAYANADVIGVREQIAQQLNDSQLIDLLTNILVSARPPETRSTPDLDQAIDDTMFRWAAERLNKQ